MGNDRTIIKQNLVDYLLCLCVCVCVCSLESTPIKICILIGVDSRLDLVCVCV